MVLDMFFRDGIGKDRKNSYVVAEKAESKASQTNDANGAVDSKAEQVEKELAETSSIEPEKPVEDYPYNQREAIEGYADGVDNRILEFLSRVRNLKDHSYRQKTNVEIAQNTERLINDVRELVGTDVTGYKHVLTGGAVEHIDKDHGKNGSSDHSMANDEDIARIGFVIENYDSAERLKDKNGKDVLDVVHQNKDSSPSRVVRFSKKINGTFYVVESVPDSKAKAMYVKSAYIEKNNSANTDEMLNVLDVRPQSPRSLRPETLPHSDSTVVNDSIRGNDVENASENVNNLQNKAASAAVNTDAVPEVTGKTDVQAEQEAESKAKTVTEPKAKTEVKTEIKAEENPEETPKVDTEAKVQAKQEGKAEVPVEPSVREDMSREANGEAKAKEETAPEMKSSAESETVSEENNGVSEEERSFLETVRHTAQSPKEALKSKKQGGIYSGTDEQTIRATEDLSKAFGVRILLFDGEGKTDIDGFYDRKTNTIYLNAGSHAKPIQATVRHEMIHFLVQANTGAFEAFRDFIVGRYAETYGKEALNTWLRNKQAEYEAAGIELNENGAKEELCADLAMDMLNDPETVKGFAKENRSAAQRILDALRRFIDKIRVLFGLEPKYSAGKARALEALAKTDSTVKITDGKVERSHASFKNDTLPKALNVKDLYTAEKLLYQALTSAEIRNSNTNSDGIRFSGETNLNTDIITAKDIDNLRSIGRKSVNDFTSEDIKKAEPFARRYFKELGVKSPFFRAWFGDWRAHDTSKVKVVSQKSAERGKVKNTDTGWNIQVSAKVFGESQHKGMKNQRALPLLDYINGIVENAVLLDSSSIPADKVKSLNSAMMHSLYAIVDAGNGHELAKLYVEELNDINTDGTIKRAYQLQNISKIPLRSSGFSTNSLAPSSQRNDYTVSQLFDFVKALDKNFKPNEVSKVVDEDGNPLVVYHGTDADFTVFKSKDGNYWFSASEDYAEAMAEERGGNRVMQTYLNMRKPYYAKLKPSQFSDPNFEAAIIREAKSKGYDGVILENDTSNDLEKDTFYVVFAPTQIKSATDNIGTFDGSNPDIRFSKSGEDVDKTASKEYNYDIENEKGRDNNGTTLSADALSSADRGRSGESQKGWSGSDRGRNGEALTETGERNDDFRRIQEEARREFARGDTERRVYAKDNESLRRRLAGILSRRLVDSGYNSGYDLAIHLRSEKNNTNFDLYTDVDAKTFHDVFEVARAFTENGELVDLHGIETTDDGIGYDNCRNYLSDDGLSGFSITPSGDLISVFNAGSKRGFLDAISEFVKQEARTLDCYASPKQNLMEIYKKKFGFKVASIMDYNMEYDHDGIAKNHQMPPVAFMVNTDEDVKTENFNKDQYDEAVAYRDRFVDKNTGGKSDGRFSKSGETADKIGSKEYSIGRDEEDARGTDEFRRIQEASQRLSDKDIELFHNGSRRVNEGLRRRLSGVFGRTLEAERRRLRYDTRILTNPITGNKTTILKGVEAKTFHDIFEIVQKFLKNGDAVNVHDVNGEYGYSNNVNFLSSTGLSGFSITPSGDLVSVFSLGEKGFLKTIRDYVKENGVLTLDCYQSDVQPLADMYKKALGMKTASLLDFNYDILVESKGKAYADFFVKTYGEAPVAFMVNTDEDIKTEHFNKDQYDEAVAYRDRFVDKNTGGKSDGHTKTSEKESSDVLFSYEALTAKPDMRLTDIYTDIPRDENGKVIRKEVADLAIQAVRDSGNKKNTEVDFYVHVDDTNSDLKVNVASVRHSLTRKPDLNAIAALNIVGLAKNAVLVNELSPRGNSNGGNVYLSVGKDSGSNLYFVRMITDKRGHSIEEIETVYAISTKKESVAHYRQGYGNESSFAFTDSTISIADLLDFVKNHFSDILPESVLQHYGISRKESAVSDSVMYSLSGDKKIQPDKKTDYSFRALTAKPDMPITKMQNISESDYAAYLADKSSFVKDMVKRAALFEKNPKNTDTQTYIHNKDTGKDILVSRESFRHGAARMDKEYAQICKNIGSLLQNAVAVNELQSRYDGENSTVFIGMAENKNNYVFVRMIAENRTQRLVSYDILYSIRKKSVKKEDVGKLPPDYTASGGSSYTSSTISIAKLLENVKRENLFSGILSADVKKALGIDSSETSANIDGVMYSLNTDKDSVQTIPKGEAPARDVDVRAFDEHGGKVSEGIRTVAEASVTPDSYVRPLLEDVAKGKYSHEIKTNKGAMARAENVIARDGYQETAERYLKDFEDGRSFGKDDIAVLQTLYAGAAQHMDYLSGTDGDITLAEKLVVAMVQTATNAGQALQAQRLLKKLSPEGTLYAYEKSVNRINRAIERSAGEWDGENNTRVKESGKGFFEKVIDSAQNGYYSPKQAPVEIDTKLKKKLLNAKNPHEMDKVCEEIENDVAKQILSTIPDKLRALRYMSMLTNPRTHVRNIVGNALFGIAIQTRDIVGTIAERAIIRDKSKRTKSIALTPKQRSEYKAIAKQAARFYDEHEAFVKGESNRYDMTTSNIEAAKKPFKNRFLGAILNAIYEFNSNLLEKEDLWFIKGHFVRQFTHALMAKGYTAEQLKNGEVPAEVLQKIAEYASNEAQKATFRDANAAATMLNRIENMSRGTKVAVSAIMPFKKTPMNILRRGIEYSPVSLITAVYKTISQNVQKSKGRIKSVDTAGIINDLSQGLTGSMIFVLGAWLLSQGLLKSGDDEDDKKQSLEEAMGKQSYSIEIGGESFTLDWAAPLCMPLFAGAEFAKALQEKEISPLQVLLRMSDPVLETSMMSGVLDFLSSGKYADGDSGIIQRMVQSAVSSYVLQFFPTAMGAVARVMDEYESRTTRTDKKGDAAFWERLGRQIVNKIPYARQVFNKPYVDVFGKQEKKEKPLDYALSLIKNTIVPGYITSVSGTKSEKVLYEVMEESKETKFIPGFVTKFAVDKVQHTLTQEEYYNYHVMRGEWYEAYLPEVASDKWFTDLEADQKAIVLESFKEIADDLTKKRVIPEYTIRSNRSKYIYNMLYGDKPVSGQEAVNVVKQVFHEIILSELAKKQAEEEREKLLDAESTEAIGK